MENTRPKDESLGDCLWTNCHYRWAAREMPDAGKLEHAEKPADAGTRSLRGPNRNCLTCRHRSLPSGNTTVDDDKSDHGSTNSSPSTG